MKIKKILSLLLLLGLLCAAWTVFLLPGHADAKPVTLSASAVTDGSFTVEVSAPGLNWAAFEFRILFDPSAMVLTSAEVGYLADALPRGKSINFISDNPENANASGILSCNATGPDAGTFDVSQYSGSLVLLTFRLTESDVQTASVRLAIRALVDSRNDPVTEYVSFGTEDEPVIYDSLEVTLRQPEPPPTQSETSTTPPDPGTDGTDTDSSASTDTGNLPTDTGGSTSTSTDTSTPTDTGSVPTDTGGTTSSKTDTDTSASTDTGSIPTDTDSVDHSSSGTVDTDRETDLTESASSGSDVDTDLPTDETDSDPLGTGSGPGTGSDSGSSAATSSDTDGDGGSGFRYWPEVVCLIFGVVFVGGCTLFVFLRRR